MLGSIPGSYPPDARGTPSQRRESQERFPTLSVSPCPGVKGGQGAKLPPVVNRWFNVAFLQVGN